MKSDRELSQEIVEHVKTEMKNTRIYELECGSKLPISRFISIISIVKEILSSEFFVGDSKDNNLLVWERNEEITQYVTDNLL